MENAAKALLIAAAILIAILILSAIVIFKDELSIYFSAQYEATMLEQVTKFNNKFQNYNGKTIQGNELVSIMNKISDYNNYQAEMVGYEKIKLEVDFVKMDYVKNGLLFDTGDTNELFSGYKIKNYNSSGFINDDVIRNIAETVTRVSVEYDISENQLRKLTSNIHNILDSDVVDEERNVWIAKALGSSWESNYNVSQIKEAICKYYQYVQLKKAMFQCIDIEYNQELGTINKMKFEVLISEDIDGNKGIKFFD